jgi:hypothetical protein
MVEIPGLRGLEVVSSKTLAVQTEGFVGLAHASLEQLAVWE